jgi:hypothetical protein
MNEGQKGACHAPQSRPLVKPVQAALCLIALSSCSFEGGRIAVEKGLSEPEALMRAEPLSTSPRAAEAGVVRMKGFRVAGPSVRLDVKVLPEEFSQKVRFLSKGAESLAQTLADVANLIGFPIQASDLLQQGQAREDNLGARWGSNGMSAAWVTSPSNEMDYEGSVQGLLDAVAAQNNLSWRFNGQSASVEFYRFETKAFSVSVPSGQKNINASISLTGVGEGASATSSSSAVGNSSAASGALAGNVSVNQATSVNPWGSIMQGVRQILSEGNSGLNSMSTSQNSVGVTQVGNLAPGNALSNPSLTNALSGAGAAQAVANPELGLITVTARPQTLVRVQQYLRSINDRFAKNVLIDVKIYSFSLDEQKSLGFGLNMLYTKLNQMNASVVSPQPLQAGVDTPGVLTLGAPTGSGAWSGSTFVAQALSQLGRVSLLKQAQVLAVNGQPSPVQVANEISFIASSATTLSPNAGSITTQTTGTKVVGFTANFLPLILGDGRILLSYQIQISSLASALTPNAQGIQTPNVASQSLQQQAFVEDGQSIVLFGYDEERNAQAQALSVGGVSRSSSKNRDMVVMVLQINTGAQRVSTQR